MPLRLALTGLEKGPEIARCWRYGRGESWRRERPHDRHACFGLHNTLSGAKELFVPLDPADIRVYACGPTATVSILAMPGQLSLLTLVRCCDISTPALPMCVISSM